MQKYLKRQKEKNGVIEFKSDQDSDSENNNPYDSEDERYEKFVKDEIKWQKKMKGEIVSSDEENNKENEE